ncbi:hypothetical protein Zmor_005136 [Zophobas morio]|uniref:Uncharacterized protein n=1 Tax=Zophobas morio TaxID=2755281 RepID=A0AA38MM14_9CUCU|nr:hypothetical protein Zmor_005136 [Zophobas morio]
MAHVTSGQITLGKAASLLGIIQGIAWFALSLACIIEYNIKTPPQNATSYMDTFNSRVYYFYLYKDAKFPPGTSVTPLAFTVFMCIYIVLNTAWVVTSVVQLNVLRKLSLNVPIVFKDWALITWIISLVDLILVIMLGFDYGRYCKDAYGEEHCTNTVIPILVIAARGFILWFVNVIIAWRMLVNADLLRRGGSYEGTFGGIFPIYRITGHIPRANVSSAPSLYSQQAVNINTEKNLWNVNLRTAMDARTPPVSPRNTQGFFDNNRSRSPKTPYERNQEFFGNNRPLSPRTPYERNQDFFGVSRTPSPRSPNGRNHFSSRY